MAESNDCTASLDMKAIGETTVGLLICSICTEVLIEPVFSCYEWHPVCGLCYEKMHNKVCYCSGMLQINRMAHRLLKLVYPELGCRYSNAGCPLKLCPSTLIYHLHKCIYRPTKCPLNFRGEQCIKRLCPVRELFAHMSENHGICATNGEVRTCEDNSFKISHSFKISYGCLSGGRLGKPVKFFASCNFVLVAELLEDILVWWLCVDDLETVSNRFKYSTSLEILENLPGTEHEITQEMDLPVYSIRFLSKKRLHKIHGSFAAQPMNNLFRKYLGGVETKDDAVLTLKINIHLQQTTLA